MNGLAAAFSIMMVGHSLFGKAGPGMLQQVLEDAGAEAIVVAQIINGAPLQYNWEHAATAEGINARDALPGGEATHLILTEAIPLANHIAWSDTHASALQFAELAWAANPDTHVYVQETWHSLLSGSGMEVPYDDHDHVPWRERLAQDLPVWEGIVAALDGENGRATLIPAGQAMALLHDEVVAGNASGLEDISALFDDDIHLNDIGHYFVSMVQFATVTGEDPTGLPVRFKNRREAPWDGSPEDLATVLQRVAWDAVSGYHGADWAVLPAPKEAEVTPVSLPAADAPVLASEAPTEVPQGTNAVAIGLAPVNDWGTQQPFLDVMKTARPWIGHKPRRWGGMEYEELRTGGFLGPHGWPLKMPKELSSIGTLVLTNMPEAAVSLQGRYRLSFDGKGVIEVGGRAENVRYGKGEVWFDYAPGPGSVDIRIQRINTTDPPRITGIVHEDYIAAFDAGQVFNPHWTRRIRDFSALRFMDWMETNNSELATWADRPHPDDATYQGGVPVEVMVQLGNALHSDLWFNMPHLADDDFVRRFATHVRDHLDPDLKVYVEFSNEVWNWQFTQSRWAETAAQERWGEEHKWMQFYGRRAAEVAGIWSEVFGEAGKNRLVNVISSQTGWLGLETEALEAPLVQADGGAAPAAAFDAYAVTGYFSARMGSEEAQDRLAGWIADSRAVAEVRAEDAGAKDVSAFVAAHQFDYAAELAFEELRHGGVSGDATDTVQDLVERVWPHHAEVARAHGLDLIMYEGGTHIVGHGAGLDDEQLTAFFQHLNYTPQMGALYDELLAGWKAVGGQLFTAYSDVTWPTKWGSWGALRHLDDENPRWEALLRFQ